MKRLILLFVLMGFGCLLATQIRLNNDFDSREGTIERLYYYEQVAFEHGFELTNTLYLKASADSDEREQDYLRNYVRDKLRFSKISDNYYVSTHFGVQYYFGDQYETRIAGAEDSYRLKNVLSGGIDWFGTWSGVETLLEARVLTNTYDRYSEVEKEEAGKLDSDGYGKASVAYKVTDWFKPFVEITHFNDMNDIDTYDYSETRFGNRSLKKLDAVHTVEMEIAAVRSDAWENLPWYADFDLRLTSKYFHDWMFIHRLTEQYWYNEDDSNKAWGEGFYEGILQHNLEFDKDNHVDRFLVAVKTYFNENVTVARTGLMVYFGPFSLYGSYHYYFGNDRMVNYKSGIDFSYYLTSIKTRFYYGFSISDQRFVENTIVHSLNFELGL